MTTTFYTRSIDGGHGVQTVIANDGVITAQSIGPARGQFHDYTGDGNPDLVGQAVSALRGRGFKQLRGSAAQDALEQYHNLMERETDMITFDMAKQIWNSHTCDSQSNVCECIFEFPCQSCGRILKIQGESMDSVIGVGGLCEMCFYRPDVRYPDNSLIAPHASE